MECIVLAGGFGTRLSHIVSDVPKPMAPVGNRPFLSYIMDDLVRKGIDRIIMAVGYKKECIINYYGNKYKSACLLYSDEVVPLGTGGAIRQAIALCNDKYIYIINGDTYFDVDLNKMYLETRDSAFEMMIAIKKLNDFDRYGILTIENGLVREFKEKISTKEGYINGGIYLIKRDIYNKLSVGAFSFEKDFMEKQINNIKIGAFESEGYFIDIGVPEDYYRACEDFSK